MGGGPGSAVDVMTHSGVRWGVEKEELSLGGFVGDCEGPSIDGGMDEDKGGTVDEELEYTAEPLVSPPAGVASR